MPAKNEIDNPAADPELEQLTAVFEAAAGGERFSAGLRLADRLAAHGLNARAVDTLKQIQPLARNDEELAGIYRKFGELYFRQSRYEEAAMYLSEAIVELGVQPDSLERFQVYRNLAWIYFRQGYLEQSRNYSSKARMVLEAKTNYEGPVADNDRAELYHILALTESEAGNHDVAFDYYEKEIRLLEHSHNLSRLGSVYNNLSGLVRMTGKLIPALEYQTRAMEIAQQTGEQLALAISHNNMGEIFFSLGYTETAEQHFQTYLSLNRQIGNRMGAAFGNAGLARIAMWRGDLLQAGKYFAEAVKVSREVKSRSKEASILVETAELLCRQSRPGPAQEQLDAAAAIIAELRQSISSIHRVTQAMILLQQGCRAAGNERNDLLQTAREMLCTLLGQPMIISDEEAISIPDLKRKAGVLLARVLMEHGEVETARQEIDRAAALVAEMIEPFDGDQRSKYLAKPEIKELFALQQETKEVQS